MGDVGHQIFVGLLQILIAGELDESKPLETTCQNSPSAFGNASSRSHGYDHRT